MEKINLRFQLLPLDHQTVEKETTTIESHI